MGEGADLRLGGLEDGIAIILSPSYLLCTIKSQMCGVGGNAGPWYEWEYMLPPPPIVRPLGSNPVPIRLITDDLATTLPRLVRKVIIYLTVLLDRRVKCREREMFYLTTHSTHFIYGYMASDIWLRTILIVRKETRCRHIGYSYRLTARVLLYAPFHRQDSTYHGLCYTSRGALAGTRNSSMGPPHEGSIRRPIAP